MFKNISKLTYLTKGSLLSPGKLMTSRWTQTEKNLDIMDKWLSRYVYMSIPAGCVGFCWGVKESWQENSDSELIRSSIYATAYGLWGGMLGSISWCLMPAILPVLGATYVYRKTLPDK